MKTDSRSQQQQSLLRQLLKAIHNNPGDRQAIYPLLESNASLLNSDFAQELTRWVTEKGTTSKSTTAVSLAKTLCRFAELIASCPQGNHRLYCEIAIASYQVALDLFSQAPHLPQYSETKTLLAELENHYHTLPSDSEIPSSQTFPNSRDGLYLSSRVEEKSYELLQWGGYGLLVLTLFKTVEYLIHIHPSSTLDRLDLAHQLIDIVWMPLIGLILVFYRQQGYVSRIHLYWLRFLSWGSLGLASLYGVLTLFGFSVALNITQGSVQKPPTAPTTNPTVTLGSQQPINLNIVSSITQPFISSPEIPKQPSPQPLGLLGGVWGVLGFTLIWRRTRWTRCFRR
ncbi:MULTISPECIES: hypothetical protein [unclassified Roseofilum]|uniref:hypothetical protein n=1 Tax=unclassified Roseofilum TaxID=2620099 RepID=UPI000E836574|nr:MULTISPECIES: hypothetical protein [unclassified Roseofilum]MBP0010640.1 hypothetical protein [Roseofilum sp. Belize Diploria]MBP0034565.1 hypothetical protein [Roseofilum sp. Belize BBD 4]HBQ98057.1 hypothetical protein [Cyanobacteria bacterium UBA11691]